MLAALIRRSAAALVCSALLVVAKAAHAGGSDDWVSPVRGVVTAGVSAASLFGVGSTAARAGVGLVGTQELTCVSWGVFVDADFGSTSGGLPLRTYTFSSPILFVSGPFRIGAGPELLRLTLTRQDRSLAPIGGLGIGLAGFVGLDLLRSERDRAIYLALRPQVAWLHNAREPLKLDHYAVPLGAALVVGARF